MDKNRAGAACPFPEARWQWTASLSLNPPDRPTTALGWATRASSPLGDDGLTTSSVMGPSLPGIGLDPSGTWQATRYRPRTRSSRTGITILPAAWRLLTCSVSGSMTLQDVDVGGRKGDPLPFSNVRSEPLTYSAVGAAITDTVAATIGVRLSPHAFRRAVRTTVTTARVSEMSITTATQPGKRASS
jgi:hypothetical protein